ncbi:MAG: cytochrome C oxidase subunit IV family protein [Nitrospinota bacterium]
MAQEHKEPNYMAIFWWLLALTILEVIVAISNLPTAGKASLLVAMALGKAMLVAMYFMHLRFERFTLGAIVLTPLVLCLFLLLMLFPDLLGTPHKTTAQPQVVEKVQD